MTQLLAYFVGFYFILFFWNSSTLFLFCNSLSALEHNINKRDLSMNLHFRKSSMILFCKQTRIVWSFANLVQAFEKYTAFQYDLLSPSCYVSVNFT